MMVVNNPLIRPYLLGGMSDGGSELLEFCRWPDGNNCCQTIDIAVWEWWFQQQLYKKRMYSIFPLRMDINS